MIGLVCACAFVWNGCVKDVAHENPLDPLSANPQSGATLTGRIVLKNQSSTGVAGAVITTLPALSIAIADSQGYFSFQNPSTAITSVVVRKSGFATDTTAVALALGAAQQVTIQLNAVPTIPSVRILTRKIDLLWPNPIYSASVTANADDLNGISDLDSVWVSVDTLAFGMTYSVSAKNFQADITASQLPTNTLEWLIGRRVLVNARDKNNSIGTSTAVYAARIIENEAAPVYPALQDTASSSPEFQWTPPSVLFAFSYTIAVVRVLGGTQTVVWTQADVGSYLRAFQYPSTLQPGNYFWTISVVDEYGNIAQSKESSFIVIN